MPQNPGQTISDLRNSIYGDEALPKKINDCLKNLLGKNFSKYENSFTPSRLQGGTNHHRSLRHHSGPAVTQDVRQGQRLVSGFLPFPSIFKSFRAFLSFLVLVQVLVPSLVSAP